MPALPNGPLRDAVYNTSTFSVDLLELHFLTPRYYSTGAYDISVDTDTAPNAGINVYTAQGDFLTFDGIAEDFDVKIGKLSVNISGLNTALVADVSTPQVIGQRVVVYRCFLDLTTGLVIGSPILLFDGQVNNVAVSETSRSATVTIDCASLFADFERIQGRKSNNDSNWTFQGFRFDTTFEKSGLLKNTDILWGRVK